MNDVFRLQKSYRNTAIVGLLFFVGMMAIPVYFAVSEGNVLLGFVFGGFWSFWIGLSAWMLLAYYVESLTIREGTILQRGVLVTTSMKLSELVDVQWRRPGVVVLRSYSGKVRIHLDNFTPEQRKKIIRWLHASTPRSIQQGWDRFCYTVAIPLRQRLEDYPLQGHILIRWHIDRIFIAAIPLIILVEAAVAWCLHSIACIFIVPIPFLLIWLAVRAGIPTKGIAVSERRRLDKRFLLGLAIWGAVGIGATILFETTEHRLPYPTWWGWAAVMLWFAGLLLHAHRAEQRMWHSERENIERAVEEWERYSER